MEKNMGKLIIAVLLGGISTERDISLISGKEVVKNLDKKKYEVKIYDPKTDLTKLIKDRLEIDLAFPVLHGRGGEDGAIQGFLELLNIPYVGSGILASSLAIDKYMAKKIFESSNILVPDYKIYNKKDTIELNKIKVPCVVKPIGQGSSVGVNIVKDKLDIKRAISKAFFYENRIVIEQFISGKEITVGVIGNDNPISLPIVEIVPPSGRFFDREVKYNGETKEIIPARLDENTASIAKEIAIKCHQSLGCRGFSRTDMIVKKSMSRGRSKVYVLETNTIPGMTSKSLFPNAARAAGIVYPELLDKLISLALEK
jgi:D-alanine-D-alanine ligase